MTAGRKVALPTAVFQRQRCWIDAPVDAAIPPPPDIDTGLPPLLGRRLSLPFASETRWEASIGANHPALGFLAEHIVAGVPSAARHLLHRDGPHRSAWDRIGRRPHPGPSDADRGRLTHRPDHRRNRRHVPHRQLRRRRQRPGAARDRPERAPSRCRTAYRCQRSPELQWRRPHSTTRWLGAVWCTDRRSGCSTRSAGKTATPSPRCAPLRRKRASRCTPHAWTPPCNSSGLRCLTSATTISSPAAIGRFVLHHPPAADATVHAFARPGPDGILADVSVSDAAGLALEVNDLLFRPASGQGATQGFYCIDWRPQPLIDNLPPPRFLPSPADLAGALDAVSTELADRHGTLAYAANAQGLEAAATAYVLRALLRLGLPFEAGTEFTFGATAEALGVAERHHRLLRRMFAMLATDGVLAIAGRRWLVLKSPAEPDPEAMVGTLLAAAPAMAGEIGVLRRCGAALADVLTGRQEPLSLLFPTEGVGAGVFYEASPYARTVNGLLAEAATRLVASLPAGRVLRILEAGAGTGGATGALLGGPPRSRRHYVFTDLSIGFLSAARQKFPGDALVTRLLDVERPPEAQGFSPASFDLILAANVLHATADIARGLAHLHSLLAPGGVLLLVESTEPRRWVDIVFGLTEGWWRFTDIALRPDHPLLVRDKWRQVLADAGFETEAGHGEVVVARRPLAPVTVPSGSLVHVVAPADPTEDGQVALLAGLTRLAVEAAATVPPRPLVLVGDDSLGHTGLGGLLRTLALEAPSLRPRLLLAPPSPEALADEVRVGEVEGGAPEAEIRWDASGQRLVPRLKPAASLASVGTVEGTWLITGGNGGVAQAIATWLATHGAAAIVLLSRRKPEPPPGVAVPVHLYAGDAADGPLIARLLHQHDVQGVVHAAGILADAALAEQNEATVRAVAHGKIGGALALDAATRAHPVRHFILCASATGILGSARQANHAFCSSFLDGLAARRRADGLPALSLDWGVWSGTGSAAARGVDALADQLGLGSITPAQGTGLFAQALNATRSQLVVLPSVDWPRFTAHFGDALPGLFRDVAAVPLPTIEAPATPALDRSAGLTRIIAELPRAQWTGRR